MTQAELGAESDAALILLSSSGTPDAFGALFERHRDRVFRHVFARIGHREEAEDSTAVVFLEAWRRRKSIFLHEGSALPWLLTTANFAVLNRRRSLRRYRRLLEHLPHQQHEDDHAPEVLRSLGLRDEHQRVRQAMGRLRLADQDILTLCIIEELSPAQAADALSIPIGTVKSRLSRAKEKLRVALERDNAVSAETTQGLEEDQCLP